MPYDYTDAPPSRDIELIPHGTIATVVLHIRAGNVGEDGLLKAQQNGGLRDARLRIHRPRWTAYKAQILDEFHP